MDLGEVALGVHDLIPVALAAVGLGMVAAAVGRVQPAGYRPAGLGAVLVVLGGLSKAIAKLIGAIADSAPPQLLDDALFPLLAPGMVLLAAAVIAGRGTGGWAAVIVSRPLLVPLMVWLVAGAVAAFAGSGPPKTLLIGIATLGNIALGVALIWWSRRLGLRAVAVLFGVNLIIVIGLAGMARALEPTTAAQWIEQNVNLVGQLAFLVASRSLLHAATGRRAKSRVGVAGVGA